MKLTVGTRGSKLALTQTEWVIKQLKEQQKDLIVDIKVIKTTGDKITNQPLDKIGDKGLFVKEIEMALLEGSIDFSVNSMKDMPADLPKGLMIVAPPMGEDHRDALVTPHDISNIAELPEGSVIATGSIRRRMQLKTIRPDINCVGIRGNVETRIAKMQQQSFDGVILAMAGLKRLSLKEEAYHIIPIDPSVMIPSPCQGVLALEVREQDEQTKKILAAIQDTNTKIRSEAERAFLKAIEGGCHAPTGAYSEIHEGLVTLTGLFGTEEKLVKKTMQSSIDSYKKLGKELAGMIKEELING